MHRLWGLAAVLLAAGCLREKVQYCNNGALCPEPLVCTERTEEPFCGSSGQVEECLGKPDETPCTVNSAKGVCDAGICIACEANNAACVYETWVPMQTPVSTDLVALWVAGPREIYVAGRQGVVIRWDGKRWTQLPTTGVADLRAITGASGTDLWAAAASTTYHFDGTDWTTTSGPQPIFGMWGAGPNDYFSVGFKSTVGRYTGSGWMYSEDILAPAVVSFNAVWGTSNADVFAVGGVGTIVHWNGTSWSSPQPTPAQHVLLAVSGSSSSNVYAVGRTGTAAQAPIVFRFDGDAWQDLTSNLPSELVVYLRGVYSTNGHVFAVGETGKMIHSTDNGASWAIMASTPTSTARLEAVAGSGTAVFAVGETGTVLRYQIP